MDVALGLDSYSVTIVQNKINIWQFIDYLTALGIDANNFLIRLLSHPRADPDVDIVFNRPFYGVENAVKNFLGYLNIRNLRIDDCL